MIVGIGKGLRGRDHNAVTGVDPHRIDIFHIADGDRRARVIAEHFVFDLLPSSHAALNQHLADRAGQQTFRGYRGQRMWICGDATARSPKRERRPYHHRIAEGRAGLERLPDRVRRPALQHGLPETHHGSSKSLPVLGVLDGQQRRSEQRHAIPIRDPGLGQSQREVQTGLTSQGGQQSVRALRRDDRRHKLRGQRLDVDAVGHLDIGHDGGRVAVDKDDLNALLAEGAAGLGAGVVKLSSLADDNRSRADDKDLPDVGPLRHRWSRLDGVGELES